MTKMHLLLVHIVRKNYLSNIFSLHSIFLANPFNVTIYKISDVEIMSLIVEIMIFGISIVDNVYSSTYTWKTINV